MLGAVWRHRLSRLLCLGCLLLIAAKANSQVLRLDIDEALLRSRRNNDALNYAKLQYEIDAARYRLSARSFFPDITVGYTQEDAVVYYGPDSHLKRLSVGVDQLVYAGGARVQQRRALSNRLFVLRHEIQRMQSELIREIVSRYIEILKSNLQTEILEENLAYGREQLAIASEELRLGEITALDHVEIELAVRDLEIELALLKQEGDRQAHELKELLGVDAACVLELTGVVNADFRGMLEVEEEQFYVEQAGRSSLELKQKEVEIAALFANMQQARRSWLPRVSTQLEISVAGAQFPLTTPGFSVGLNFDFDTPVLPFRTGITAGGTGGGERSLGTTSYASPGTNIEALQSPRTARLELAKAESSRASYRRNLEYTVRQQYRSRCRALDILRLEESRLELQARRYTIEAIMLEMGETTRLQYLQSGVELARRRIEQLSRIVSLFHLEADLLDMCGPEMSRDIHNHILLAAGSAETGDER
jgi:outer membrane protein TolC